MASDGTRGRWRYWTAAITICSACGSGVGNQGTSSLPTLPTPAARDFSGEWVQVDGGSRTWTLSQTSVSVGGPASFSEENNPTLGQVSGRGGLLGAVTLFGTLRFGETYESLTIPSRPSPNFCWIETDGELTISGNRMTGTYTEIVGGCTGGNSIRSTRSLVMERR